MSLQKKFQEKKDKKDQILAIITNTIQYFQKKKKKYDYNISEVIYYNYNKKNHYINI